MTNWGRDELELVELGTVLRIVNEDKGLQSNYREEIDQSNERIRRSTGCREQ